ncbi:MAG: hypothetical protein ABSH38_13150 [Verrucomicrobiota bacterium]|jgi:hypothetical protein
MKPVESMRQEQTNLSSTLRAAGARLKGSLLLAGACGWLAVCLGAGLVLFLFDDLLSLPAGLRLPLALGGAFFSGVFLFQKVLRVAWRRQTPERTALMLEARYGIRDNLLINAIQFQRQSINAQELPFAARTVAASENITSGLRVSELWDWPKLRVWGGAAMAVVLVWAAVIAFFPRQFAATAARYALPLSDVPPPGDLVLRLTPGSDVTVAEGENLEVGVAIEKTPRPTAPAPPLIVWREKSDFIQPAQNGGEHSAMEPLAPSGGQPPSPGKFVHVFANIQTPFAFRVFAGDTFTRSVAVKVWPAPRLQDAAFRVTPPAYCGLKPQSVSGPPAPLAVLAGSQVEISFAIQPPVQSATWKLGGNSVAFGGNSSHWKAVAAVTNSGAYEIEAAYQLGGKPLAVARGDVQIIPDNPPEVDFVTEDRNRLVQFGQTLQLEILARDDFGLAEIAVVARPTEKDEPGRVIKRWTYLGPPGNPGPLRESFSWVVDPRLFESGASYYLEALANDFRPGGLPSRSRPIVLRLKSSDDLALRDDDPLKPAFDALKRASAAQERATRLTANLRTYLHDVLQKNSLASQVNAVSAPQNEARGHASEALSLFSQQTDGKPYAETLSGLVHHDMAAAQDDLRSLYGAAESGLPGLLAGLETRQGRILTGLLSLLGQIADARTTPLNAVAEGKNSNQTPATDEARAREWMEEMKNFVAEQERLLEKSRTLAAKEPEDLTQADEAVLGELSRDEDKWAKFLEEKLTDFSKLPQQDFADASLAREGNSVFQEVQEAAEALTQKNIELAVPHEQSGLENAKELVNNLERWLPDTPDNIKWSMEEPLAPTDIALAELPKELEDIVGELLDKEEQMTPEVEDVTSSWLDSADKEAGWDAIDGPISDMSTKGVTGNRLPNQNEVGGRSGEGRTGRSHGQMVGDTAEGKGGRETPTRLEPEPFEQGSVKDSAKNDSGGATGGGKLSGFGGEGLRGPAPPPSSQKLPRLAEQQAKIRQQAEALALQLRRYHLSGGELETSVNAMNRLEQAAHKEDGLGVRRAFSQAVNSLGAAKNTVQSQAAVRREQDKLPPWVREQMRVGVQDGVPKGYEEMVAEYYRALAEGRSQ